MNSTPIFKCVLVRDGSAKTQPTINSSERAKAIAQEMLKDLPVEHFLVIALTTKLKIIGSEIVSQGTIDAAIVSPRDVYRFALMVNAKSIIVAHNHPSGDTRPSTADVDVTERLKKVGQDLGIDLLDHLIVGEDSVNSYADGWGPTT